MKTGALRVVSFVLIAVVMGGAGYYFGRFLKGNEGPSFEEAVNSAATAAAKSKGEGGADAQTAGGTVTGVGAGAATDSADADTRPTRLPNLTLPDIDGKPRSLSEWQGRPLLINFWATWCEPCRREIPLLVKLRAQHAKDGLEVIGIAIDFRDAVKAYAPKAGMTYPVLVAEEDATTPKAFGVGLGLPTTVLASRDGRIVANHVGELDEAEAAKLLAGIL